MPSRDEQRTEPPKPIGWVDSPPTTNVIRVGPQSAIKNFRPKMVVEFMFRDRKRIGTAEVQSVDVERAELTFLANLNVYSPDICEGDTIHEWEMPCSRCRCKRCEPTQTGDDSVTGTTVPAEPFAAPPAAGPEAGTVPRRESPAALSKREQDIVDRLIAAIRVAANRVPSSDRGCCETAFHEGYAQAVIDFAKASESSSNGDKP